MVNDINKPKSAAGITLLENGIKISNEKEVAEIFNVFFVEKIVKLKENIDPNYVEDPLTRLKEKLKGKNLHFKLKTVTEAKVLKTILGLKNKKSSGLDEVTHEQLKMAAEILAIPLTRIINQSISDGKFPDIWKIGVVTPVLKKGSPLDKTNYRPVTCLSVLSKVLEKVICDQITNYMESNNLLPPNQHGFRSGRSTMSALASVMGKQQGC